ncbi:Hypothetical protein CINCED_3A024363, partial [Cinara cedri]
ASIIVNNFFYWQSYVLIAPLPCDRVNLAMHRLPHIYYHQSLVSVMTDFENACVNEIGYDFPNIQHKDSFFTFRSKSSFNLEMYLKSEKEPKCVNIKLINVLLD